MYIYIFNMYVHTSIQKKVTFVSLQRRTLRHSGRKMASPEAKELGLVGKIFATRPETKTRELPPGERLAEHLKHGGFHS